MTPVLQNAPLMVAPRERRSGEGTRSANFVCPPLNLICGNYPSPEPHYLSTALPGTARPTEGKSAAIRALPRSLLGLLVPTPRTRPGPTDPGWAMSGRSLFEDPDLHLQAQHFDCSTASSRPKATTNTCGLVCSRLGVFRLGECACVWAGLGVLGLGVVGHFLGW